MFNFQMDLCSYFTCLHVLELLLFIAAIITYGIYLSYMPVLFRINIFNIFKYIESMSLISLNLQQSSALQQQVGCDCECEWLSSHHVVVDGARACAFSWLDFCTGAHRSGEQFRGPWGDPWVDIETRSEPAIIWVSKPENSWRKIGPDLESDRSQTRGSST
jgi:hypothetical protein